jgi:hypothetical protein
MAQDGDQLPRDSKGRFTKRHRARATGARIRSEADSSSTSRPKPTGDRKGVATLAVLSLAMVMGVAGFVVPVLWIVSLVLMGTLWGAMATERRRETSSDRGLVADVVELVVDEARGVADSAHSPTSRPDHATAEEQA